MPAQGTLEERLRAVLERWVAYVEEHTYAWRMLFRDDGGGPEVQAFRRQVRTAARDVLAGTIAAISPRPSPSASSSRSPS